MANSKRHATGRSGEGLCAHHHHNQRGNIHGQVRWIGGGGGGEGRCALHRGTSQEKWLRTRDVVEDIAGNLKEAIKVLRDENSSSVLASGPPSVQAIESKRKSYVKKVLSKLGRALNQVTTVELFAADLNEEMHTLQKAAEKFQMNMSKKMEDSTSSMHERVEYYKSKMQETLDSLQNQENLMAGMFKELEAARVSADLANNEKLALEEHLRLRSIEQGSHDPEEHLKLVANEENLRTENEKLKKLYLAVLKEKEAFHSSNETSSKNVALAAANVERYKEVVAKVTADNMVFLMKLKHSEAALSSAQGKVAELQKEVDNGRAQWLDEASCEIQEVIRSSLSKAETCEANLQVLQRRQANIDAEWEEKLVAATEKVTQISSSRDWLEKNLVEVTNKYKALEDEKLKVFKRYESECHHRQHAEAESRALICTLRKTNEELAQVKSELGAAIKETEAQRNCVIEKEKEVNKVLADLEKTNCQLQTQQAINTTLMKKKEEVEWELMAAEAQRAQLHQNLHERLSSGRNFGKSSPVAGIL